MIPGISTLRCLLNGQDQDKPAQVQMIGRFHTLNDKKMKIFRENKMYHLELAAYTSLFKESGACLSSFKQYCCVSHSM
jgi:hypothetical protein